MSRLMEHIYERDIVETLRKARHISRLKDLTSPATKSSSGDEDAENDPSTVFAAYYQASGPDDAVWENEIAPYFGLWNSIPNIRNSHKGKLACHVLVLWAHCLLLLYHFFSSLFLICGCLAILGWFTCRYGSAQVERQTAHAHCWLLAVW